MRPAMIAVDSSNVEAVGYDPGRMELHVRFHGGPRVYVYLGVPREVFEEMLAAESKGRFVWRRLRDVFEFRREEGEPPLPVAVPSEAEIARAVARACGEELP